MSVMRLLTRLSRERGKTLVMVTHSAEVSSLADRILRLDHGRLIVQSPMSAVPEQVVRSDIGRPTA